MNTLKTFLFVQQASFFDDAADLFDDVFPDDKFVPTDILGKGSLINDVMQIWAFSTPLPCSFVLSFM